LEKFFIDQIGRRLIINTFPKRIISLVPSQTEFLADMGLDNELIGITKFCIHPDSFFRSKTRVGGTKQFNFELIRSLNPDLIICNKEENEKSQVEALMEEFPVWVSDIYTLDDAFEMMRQLGAITGKIEKATEIINTIKSNFNSLPPLNELKSAAYLIWKNPYMVAGGNNIIDHLLEKAGFRNVFSHIPRYPQITIEELKSANPDFILLSSEPYPFKEKHIEEIQSYLPEAKVLLVDGELFSWYGSRLIHAPEYYSDLRKELGINNY
jgi:ABC-type Fe3+-hydroxamate transport system substrate-binding protein